MARHMCELSGRTVIDRALGLKSVAIEPVMLLGMKCEVIYQQDSYLKRVSDEYDNGEIGVAGSRAAAVVLSLRTWYDYSDSAHIPFVMLVCEDDKFNIGCCLFKSSAEQDVMGGGLIADELELLQIDLAQDMQSVIDNLPTWVQLHLFASLVAAVIDSSSDERLTNGCPTITYIGNPGRLVDFCGEQLGLLRLLKDGHVNVELLTAINWTHYIKRTHKQINGYDPEVRDKRDGISSPTEYLGLKGNSGSMLWRAGRYNMDLDTILANMQVQRDDGEVVDRLIEAEAEFYADQIESPFEFDPQQPGAVVRGIRG